MHFSFKPLALISSINSPLFIIPYLVTILDNSSNKCDDIRNVIFFSLLSLTITSLISLIPSGSNPFIGSSNISNYGSPNNAIAIPSLCRIPSEKSLAFLLPVLPIPTIFKISLILLSSAP